MSTNQKQSKDKTTSLMKKRSVSKNHTENAKTIGVIIRDE